MAWVLQHFQASTQEIADEALQKGILKYPAICYVQRGNYFLWVTSDNTLVNVGGYNQITDVQYTDGILSFMSGSKILFATKIGLDAATIEDIKNEIIENFDLTGYVKAEDAIKLIDNKIGDLGRAANVVEYLKTLSYDSLINIPINNIYGSLTKTIVISELPEGTYKIHGQFKIGGDYQTVQMSSAESIFLVQRNDIAVYITQLLGDSIELYTITETGSTLDKYITQKWIEAQDFITSANVKDYIKELIDDSIIETVDAVLDERIVEKFEAIPDEDIESLFI